MMVSGEVALGMAMVSKNGQMVPYTKVTGKIIALMDKVNSLIWMEIYIVVTGFMIRLMAMAYTAILMELNTRAFGKKISNKEKEKKPGPMDQNILANM